ncbi:hypothetical protein WJX73_010086 [Symbiochloris irregularis]|uniref:Cupin type-2 domain-containing protein n=1 Tax=Symbiochloris irregularis TaxID=706552 RepID=A0AAW1NGG3_9CHLO
MLPRHRLSGGRWLCSDPTSPRAAPVVPVRAAAVTLERDAVGPASAPAELQCLHRSLKDLPVHYMRHSGKLVVPLVLPSEDCVPLAMALELSTTPAANHLPAQADDALQDCFALRYVLDGLMQAPEEHIQAQALETGDSLLTLHPPANTQQISTPQLITTPSIYPAERGTAALVIDNQPAANQPEQRITPVRGRHRGQMEAFGGPGGGLLRKAMRELVAMRLPNQSNRLALVFDPLNDPVPFTFGVEIFEQGHKTKPHSHAIAHELFYILAGQGEGFCNGRRFPLSAGDVVVFPPQSVHGIDNSDTGRMYCLELMLPNDMFAELVEAGTPTGGLSDEDLCVLIAAGCGS